MKLFVKMLLLLLIIGLVAPFFIRLPNGQPMWQWNQVGVDLSQWTSTAKSWWYRAGQQVEQAGNTIEASIEGGEAANVHEHVMYRYRGDDGSWVFSDTPHPTRKSVTMVINTDQNVIQAPKPRESVVEVEETANTSPQFDVPLPMTIPHGDVEKLINDARNVQKLMDQRNGYLEKLERSSE